MSGEAPGLIEKLYISRIGLFMSCLSASKYLKSQRCAMVKSFFSWSMPSHIWRFPEIGVPPKIIYFNWDFPLWTIQLWGYPYLHMEANFKRIDNRALISGSSSMRSIEIPYFVHAWINWNHNSLDQIVHQEISSFVAVIPARSRSRTVISSLFRNYPTFCCHKSQHVTTAFDIPTDPADCGKFPNQLHQWLCLKIG